MKHTIKNIIAVIVLITSISIKIDAQETKVTGDLEQWTSIGLSKKINKHWKISLKQEFRFTQDVSRFDVYLADLGIDYKINKHFTVGANYRFYQNKNNDEIFKTQHRWNTDFQFKQKLNRFSLSYRLRFQNRDEDFFTNVTSNNSYNLRNKLSADYSFKNFKLDPFFNVELYREIENVNPAEFNKLRWTIGLEYPLKKFGDLEIFYRIDNELNDTYPKDTYIFGLGYEFSF